MPVFGPGGGSTGIGLPSLALPLQLPALPAFASIVITMEDNIGISESPLDFTTQSFDWDADRLSATVTLPGGMMAATARAWVAFLAACRGRLNPFLLSDTSQPYPRGSAAGVPVVDGAGQLGRQLALKGWTPSTLVLRSGDGIQVGTGLTQRLHFNLLDVVSDGSGNAVLDIYPTLRESPAANSPIVTSNPRGVFVLASNARKFSVDNALQYGMTFDATEYLANG